MDNKNTNIVDRFMEAQKTAVDTIVENTKKFANGNQVVTETVEKGSEWFNNILDNQKKFFTYSAKQNEQATESAQENVEKMNGFYQNWFTQQMDWAKKVQDSNMSWVNNLGGAMNNNPFMQANNSAQNWMNSMNNWNAMSQNWNKQFSNFMPNMAGMADMANANQLFGQFYEMLNNNMKEFQSSFQNGNFQDTWKNMLNANENYTRFYELWAPMWKSIQEKSFNTDLYKQWMNPSSYKEMMDKFFGFLPEQAREYMMQQSSMMMDAYKQASSTGSDFYSQMKGFANQNPMMTQMGNPFQNMMSGYTNWHQMLSESISPIAKMITPNDQTRGINEWADIMNRLMVFHIKNAEMQYMVYQNGVQVMDQIAENVAAKVKNGEEINSMMDLYQEWMKMSDKQFVELFGSEDYSKLMGEVSSLQLRLKKDIELQAEKMLTNVPVATRSELDELYKTIYDLKKQVRQLERMMEVEPITETPVAEAQAQTTATPTSTEATDKTTASKKANNNKK